MSVPVVYQAPAESTSPRWCDAFARGCGGTVVASTKLLPGSVALFGSPTLWDLLERAREQGRTVFYGDHAYFGRGKYYRVTRDALQHDGTGPGSKTRFQSFGIPIRPWRRTGSHVVVCPNSPAFFKLKGDDVDRWLGEVVRILAEECDRSVRVRWKANVKRRSLAEDLRDAWALVTYSSNAAVDAIAAGVPVFVSSFESAAYRMGLQNLRKIETPFLPDDREAFLYALAANQWTMEEMARGDCWRAIGDRN